MTKDELERTLRRKERVLESATEICNSLQEDLDYRERVLAACPTWAEWEDLKAAQEQAWREKEGRWSAKLADRERLIEAFQVRCQKLEAVAEAARTIWEEVQDEDKLIRPRYLVLGRALAALEEKP